MTLSITSWPRGLTDATLVGHSFGGNALSGAAEAIPDRIAELVYLDSTIVQPGQRPIDAIDADKLKNRMKLAQNHAVGLPPPPASAFGITDPADTAWVETQMTDHPLATMLDALPIQHRPRQWTKGPLHCLYESGVSSGRKDQGMDRTRRLARARVAVRARCNGDRAGGPDRVA